MIKQFINYLVTLKGYSQNTAAAYERDLHDFVEWAQKNLSDARWSTITRADIDQYIMSLVADGLKPATTNRRLASIAGLYRWFKREGRDIENPCRFESRRKLSKTLPNTIPTEDIKCAYEHSQGVTRVMLGLLASTGIRIQELLDITWEDINFAEQSIRINGKGCKQRTVYTTSDKLETLKTLSSIGTQTGCIFTMDQRTARHMIWEALKPYSRAKQLSPHAIRHTVATNMAIQGANVTTIATILGHNDIKTTQKYIDMTQGNPRAAYTQFNLFN